MKNSIIELPEAKLYYSQNIRGKNDINGNPNRIFLIYDAKMNYLGWIDDGYAGENWMLGRNIKRLPSIDASPRQYKTGQQFYNDVTKKTKIKGLKDTIRIETEKIRALEAKEGYWFNFYSSVSPERVEMALKDAKNYLRNAKTRLKELRKRK